MRTKVLVSSAAAVVALAGGALLVVPDGSSEKAPLNSLPAQQPLAQAATDGISAFLCLVGYDGKVATGGPQPSTSPFEGTAASAMCSGKASEIGSFSLGTEQTINMTAQSSGAGAGKITFNPASFTLPLGALSNQLFQQSATGQPFKYAYVAFRRNGATTAGSAYTVRMALAAVKTFDLDFADGSLNGAKVTMEYGGLQLINRAQDSTATLSSPSVSGWNKITNVQDINPTSTINTP